MMNKKGQVLVTFILLLPIIFIIACILIDLGNNLIIKRKNENILHDALIFAAKDEEFNEIKFKKNLEENLSYETLEIKKEESILKIKVISKIKSIFSSVINLGLDKVEVSIQYDLENKRIIRK